MVTWVMLTVFPLFSPSLYINLMMQNNLKKEWHEKLLKHKLRNVIKMFYIKYLDSFSVDQWADPLFFTID